MPFDGPQIATAGLWNAVASNFGTILAVDDDEWDLDALRDALVPGGYQVLTATDGNSALALFLKCSTNIDLVVSDIKMSPMTGWELGAQLVHLAPRLPIILVSSYAAPESFLRQKPAFSPISFLRKPFAPEDLRTKVEKALQSRPDKLRVSSIRSGLLSWQP